MDDRQKIRRMPKVLERGIGLVYCGFSLFFIFETVKDGIRFGWDFSAGYSVLTGIVLLLLGLILIFNKKGLPLGWKDWALLSRQAQEEPDGLNEALPPEERLEHLEIMREQEVLSQEEYEAKRKEILREL